MSDTATDTIHALVARIRPILAHQPPMICGAVLADLLAIWLAGHQVVGDAEGTRETRAALLSTHLDLVHQLVPINARDMGTTP